MGFHRACVAALRFQPTKRPQIQQKQKPKTGFPRPIPASTSSSSPDKSSITAPSPAAAAGVRNTIADWTQDDDDVNGFYAVEKRQRGGRKKRNKKSKEAPMAQDWDDIYDPSRPNSYEEYKNSEERYREIRDWKDRLYAHRIKRHRSMSSDLSSDEDRSRIRSNCAFSFSNNRSSSDPSIVQFAPPSNLNFAPPPIDGNASVQRDDSPVKRPLSAEIDMHERSDGVYHGRMRMKQTVGDDASAPLPPPADIDMDESGEDAYARRMRMSQAHQPPSAPVVEDSDADRPRPRNILERIQASASVAKAPVLLELPPAPADIPASEAELEAAIGHESDADADHADTVRDLSTDNNRNEDELAPRSNRPGQKGFAERLMAKYGYTKGSGLGAQGQGITSALKVKVEKRKKRPDTEGGGFVSTGGKGTIIGGKKNVKNDDEEGKFGAMSEVVVLKGMLAGIDVVKEMSEGLIEDIGEECGNKYGRVERVFVWQDHGDHDESPPVFVKFTSQLSALRVSVSMHLTEKG